MGVEQSQLPTLWAPEETAFGRVEVVSVDVVVMGVGAIIVPAIWLLSWAPLVGNQSRHYRQRELKNCWSRVNNYWVAVGGILGT